MTKYLATAFGVVTWALLLAAVWVDGPSRTWTMAAHLCVTALITGVTAAALWIAWGTQRDSSR